MKRYLIPHGFRHTSCLHQACFVFARRQQIFLRLGAETSSLWFLRYTWTKKNLQKTTLSKCVNLSCEVWPNFATTSYSFVGWMLANISLHMAVMQKNIISQTIGMWQVKQSFIFCSVILICESLTEPRFSLKVPSSYLTSRKTRSYRYFLPWRCAPPTHESRFIPICWTNTSVTCCQWVNINILSAWCWRERELHSR